MERNKIQSVCVFCASSTQAAPVYYEAATQLGRLLATHQIRVINGAGNTGLMAAVTDGALAAGGKVTGVIPRFMVEQQWCHLHLTERIEVETMHERKERMTALSDGIVALPGGVGTLEELLEIITWKQLGLYYKPIVILNIDGYYDPLLCMFAQAVERRFMREEHTRLWTVAQTPEVAIEQLYTQPFTHAGIRRKALV